jgi:peroxiredoxin
MAGSKRPAVQKPRTPVTVDVLTRSIPLPQEFSLALSRRLLQRIFEPNTGGLRLLFQQPLTRLNYTMKKLLTILTALTMAAAAFAVEIGKPAPDFTGTDINGKTVKLSDYKGKIVVIESYNSDCPFCHNQYATGAMQELQRDLAAKNVVWLLVDSVNTKNFSYRTPEQARKEFVDLKITATAWIDDNSGVVGHLYGMLTTPHMFVIATDGALVYDGAIDNRPAPSGDPRTAKNYVRAAVDELLAGKPVAVSQTKPYGCGVHYAN